MTPEELQQIGAVVQAAEERIRSATAEQIGGLRAEIIQVEERLNARIEHVETSLLTEFHKWASPLEMRMKSHTAALRAMDAELEYQSDRISKLEGKKPDA